MIRPTQVLLTATERVMLGMPAATAIAAEAERLGAARVFLLVSRHLAEATDEIRRIEAALGWRHAATHHGIRPHVPRADVLAATDAARAAGTDLLVTVGGGSVTDAGKIVTLCLKHDVATIEGFDALRTRVEPDGTVTAPQISGPDVRCLCVPTTLSGGEFNPLSGATDTRTGQKQGYSARTMAPVAVILDPAITVHTPEWLWLSTGVRAIDHAAEALGSLQSNDYCDSMAEAALRLLSEGLLRVKADPHDLEARLKCQIGAWQAMLPILAGVPMGASHAIGHVLGSACDVPHGYCSCVMAPAVQAWNEPVNAHRQTRISAGLGDAALPAAVLLDRLIRALGMPRTLAAVGVEASRLPMIAGHVHDDIWGRTNPRPIATAADAMAILQAALG
jgi:alcohol dehydrogenase class IV